MDFAPENQISRPATVLHGRLSPEPGALLSGYAALVAAYDLKVPLPEQMAAVSPRHRRYDNAGWAVYTPRHRPEDTLVGHLAFALRYEGVDLALLRALFASTGGAALESWVRREPVGRYARRAWFFYEWLLDQKLDLPDATTGNFIDALDPKRYWVGPATPSKRHRVRDNLPGVRDFCPLTRRTAKLEAHLARNLRTEAWKTVDRARPGVLARAAAFLLLADSRASFEIEGERPGPDRVKRWGRAIGQAGSHPLTVDELLRLQRAVIVDARFVKFGLREEGGFVGAHDRDRGEPLPDHVSARWQDLPRLLEGMIATDTKLRESGVLDPVISAAMIAFGFVFIHPFADGNGRVHRYLVHHVLAERGFAPPGIVFPVSAVILGCRDEYRRVLEAFSRPRLALIEWRATSAGNVEVLNETIDLYRYFDSTRQAEFLCDCVAQTIERDLPQELRFLERYDRMRAAVDARFDMPSHQADLLIRFLRQNDGVFSKRAREKEFQALTNAERRELETLYGEIFAEAG